MSYKEQLNEFATFNNHVKSVREGNVSKENVQKISLKVRLDKMNSENMYNLVNYFVLYVYIYIF